MNMSNADTVLSKLKEKVFSKRPLLKNIIDHSGNLSLFEYSKNYYRPANYPVDPTRKAEFLNAISQEISSIYGKEIAEKCYDQLNNTYHVANTEHHGTIGTSRQLNNNLISSLPYLETKDENYEYNIVIACSNISFNNWTFPRGFQFHTYTNSGLSENHLSFFGHTVDSYPVIYHKPYNSENLKNIRKSLYTMWNERFVWKREYKKLSDVIDQVFADPDVLNQTSYTDQAAKINFLFWNKISETLHTPMQKLIFVEQERLANRLILENLNKDNLINKILFSEDYLQLVTKYFDGILCGFSEEKKYGTFHFWALPSGKKYRTQLWRNGTALEASDGSYKVALDPESIAQAIQKNELIPSTLLCFILFSFYYGVRQIGGPNQTTYLTQMKQAYVAMQEELQDSENIRLSKDVPTTDITPGNPPVLGFLRGPRNELISATPLDFYLYGKEDSLALMVEVSKNISLAESIFRTLPLWYKRCYSEEEREESILLITPELIDETLGLKEKIKPFNTIGDKVILH